MRKLQQWAVLGTLLILWFGGRLTAQLSSARTATAAISSAAAASPVASPEEVGLSSERLDRIGEAIQKSVDAGRIAGAVSLVARHGKIAYFKAFGMADREAKKPMRNDNIFRMCSMSKPITTAAVMMLYEEGLFTLNEPVSDFIPEFKNMKVLDPPFPLDKTSPPGALVDAKRPITIFDLLTPYLRAHLSLDCQARQGLPRGGYRYRTPPTGGLHRGFDKETRVASAAISAGRRLGIQLVR